MEQTGAVILTPHETLIFPGVAGDWRETLFDLAARREQAMEPTRRFWRSFAESFLVRLCRLPPIWAPGPSPRPTRPISRQSRPRPRP